MTQEDYWYVLDVYHSLAHATDEGDLGAIVNGVNTLGEWIDAIQRQDFPELQSADYSGIREAA